MTMLRGAFVGLLVVLACGLRAKAANLNDFVDFSLRNDAGSLLLPGRLYVPPEATSNPAVPRPFILFMHGAGESGVNNSLQVNSNIDNLLAEAKRRGAFLYAPQTNSGWANATVNGRVMTVIDRAQAERNVDERRLYVTGLSMGGGGTWNMLHNYGDQFAAGVPICAVAPAGGFSAAGLLDEAVWAFHARNDGTVNVVTSRNVVNSVLAANGEPAPTYLGPRDFVDFHTASNSVDFQYTEYYTGGHGIWGRVYNTPAMYEWMFSHALVPEPGAAAIMASSLVGLAACKRRRTVV